MHMQEKMSSKHNQQKNEADAKKRNKKREWLERKQGQW